MCIIYGNFNQALTRKWKILHSRKRSQKNCFPIHNYSNKIPCNYKDNGSFLVAQMVKNLPNNSGDLGLITGLGRSSWEGNGNALQYSCLEDSMDRGASRAAVHGVAKSWTRLILFTFTHFTPSRFLDTWWVN